jgi:hypothetical protein
MNIVRDDYDRWRFLQLVRYLNDDNVPRNWERDVTSDHIKRGFERPESWGEPEPYVSILAYCLMDNHFHLLVQEKVDGGVSKFMQRLCTSMSLHYNMKYSERGTLFQGAYKAKTVQSDDHLQYLSAYIHVKNPFERYPGGISRASKEFDKALRWAEVDPFSSLADFLGSRRSALLDFDAIDDVFDTGDVFESFARDVIEGRVETGEDLRDLLLDT